MPRSRTKRAAPSESSQSQSQSGSSAPAARPHKRAKLDPPPPPGPPAQSGSSSSTDSPSISTSTAPIPSTFTNPDPLQLQPSVVDATTPPAAKNLLPPPAPPKRAFHAGSLRRLGGPHVHTGSTLSGAKIGGKSKDLKTVEPLEEELWVTRKGLGFAGYLKKGVSSFIARGATSLRIHGMGAAIPLALSLSLAIRDAVPGGAPSEDGEEGSVKIEVRTGSTTVPDEITPDDEDEDIVYQVRHKSVVEVVLTLTVPVSTVRDVSRAGRGGGAGRGRGRGGRGRGG